MQTDVDLSKKRKKKTAAAAARCGVRFYCDFFVLIRNGFFSFSIASPHLSFIDRKSILIFARNSSCSLWPYSFDIWFVFWLANQSRFELRFDFFDPSGVSARTTRTHIITFIACVRVCMGTVPQPVHFNWHRTHADTVIVNALCGRNGITSIPLLGQRVCGHLPRSSSVPDLCKYGQIKMFSPTFDAE